MRNGMQNMVGLNPLDLQLNLQDWRAQPNKSGTMEATDVETRATGWPFQNVSNIINHAACVLV